MNESMDRGLADWLRDGPDQGPREGLERALAATRSTRQRPGWTFPERWLSMQLTMQRSGSLRPLFYLALLALLVAAIAAAALFIGSRQQRLPAPFGPAGNGAIAFERGGDILVSDALSGTARPLVTGPERDSYPAFSRQGTRVAFIRSVPGGFDLMAVDPDGSRPLRLGGPYEQIDRYEWSPDGSTVVVGWIRKGLFKVNLVAADGSGERDLDVGMPADLPTWRPGTRELAFRGQPPDDHQAAAVYLVGADGAGLRELDLGPPEIDAVVEFEGLMWSPDGAHLAYMRGVRVGDTFPWRVFTANVDPTGHVSAVWRVDLGPGSSAEMLAKWSPDGQRLAFILERDGSRQIAVAPADGSLPAQGMGPKVPAAVSGIGHAWAPDGRTLLVTFLPEGAPQTFWSIEVDTGRTTELEGPFVEIPTWQRLAP